MRKFLRREKISREMRMASMQTLAPPPPDDRVRGDGARYGGCFSAARAAEENTKRKDADAEMRMVTVPTPAARE